jgi:hypothetical protein
VTFPLDLALVFGVLELRANDALERTRLQTKNTRSLRRNVIEITATWDTLENSLLLPVFRGSGEFGSTARNIESQKEFTDAKSELLLRW